MSDASYAHVDANAVVTACANWLEDREQEIQRRRDKLIDAVMSARWFPAKTREAAIARLSRDRFDDYVAADLYLGYAATRIERLKKLALASLLAGDSKVFVCSVDADLLLSHMVRAG